MVSVWSFQISTSETLPPPPIPNENAAVPFGMWEEPRSPIGIPKMTLPNDFNAFYAHIE